MGAGGCVMEGRGCPGLLWASDAHETSSARVPFTSVIMILGKGSPAAFIYKVLSLLATCALDCGLLGLKQAEMDAHFISTWAHCTAVTPYESGQCLNSL